MPYKYVAYAPSGEMVRGTVDAATEEMAEDILWQSDYTVVSLQVVRPRPSLGDLVPSLFGVKKRDVIIFSEQLATLIESGIPILRSLRLLQSQASKPAFKKVLWEIVEDVQGGSALSDAMSKHPMAFPEVYHRMVQVGERTGNLEGILRRMAGYMEKEDALVRKVRGAMAYPAFILLMAIGVVWVMVTVTLPALMGLLTAFDVPLPITTRTLIAVTSFVGTYQMRIEIVVSLVVAIVVMYTRTEMGQRHKDLIMLKLPLIGAINSHITISRFSNTMSVLLRAGLPIPEIMDLVLQTTDNVVFHDAVEQVRRELLQGQGLSRPMSVLKVFPTLLVSMVRVGEEAGTLDSNLEIMGNFYEQEADRSIDMLTGLIQPALMLFVGGLVGFIAVSVILPIYSVYGTLNE